MTDQDKADMAKSYLESPVYRAVYRDIRERFISKLEVDASEKSASMVALNLQLLKMIFETALQSYVNDLTMVKHRQEADKFIERTRETYQA